MFGDEADLCIRRAADSLDLALPMSLWFWLWLVLVLVSVMEDLDDVGRSEMRGMK